MGGERKEDRGGWRSGKGEGKYSPGGQSVTWVPTWGFPVISGPKEQRRSMGTRASCRNLPQAHNTADSWHLEQCKIEGFIGPQHLEIQNKTNAEPQKSVGTP